MSWTIERSDERLELAGELRIADAAAIWRTLGELATPRSDRLDLDLNRVDLVDGAIMSLLVETRAELIARGMRSELVNASDRVAPLVHLYRGDQPALPRAAEPTSPWLERLGGAVMRGAAQVREAVLFAGQLIGAFVADIRRINWRALPALIERAGTDGIPIILILDFLVGFVMAYQSTHQLKTYGANTLVADLVGISVTRELAPLMTAIIIAGRSGAAYAAELGTMRVTEEIDALRTMGFSPISHLVAPRMLALAVVAPVVTLLGDIAGIVGGLVVGATSLGVTPHGYMAELRHIVEASDVWTGLIKSVAFGIAIAFIGCRRGLSTRNAAAGVGRGTTAAVVSSLLAIVVIDTGCTMVFRELGV
jgi:phospholipid/cholesterol/gamma-HCH transport system permease protein